MPTACEMDNPAGSQMGKIKLKDGELAGEKPVITQL